MKKKNAVRALRVCPRCGCRAGYNHDCPVCTGASGIDRASDLRLPFVGGDEFDGGHAERLEQLEERLTETEERLSAVQDQVHQRDDQLRLERAARFRVEKEAELLKAELSEQLLRGRLGFSVDEGQAKLDYGLRSGVERMDVGPGVPALPPRDQDEPEADFLRSSVKVPTLTVYDPWGRPHELRAGQRLSFAPNAEMDVKLELGRALLVVNAARHAVNAKWRPQSLKALRDAVDRFDEGQGV